MQAVRSVVGIVHEHHLKRELRLAETAAGSLDFFSAGMHFRRAGFLARDMRNEPVAITSLEDSSTHFELEAYARAPLVTHPLSPYSGNWDWRMSKVIESLKFASETAEFADMHQRSVHLRSLVRRLEATPEIVDRLGTAVK